MFRTIREKNVSLPLFLIVLRVVLEIHLFFLPTTTTTKVLANKSQYLTKYLFTRAEKSEREEVNFINKFTRSFYMHRSQKCKKTVKSSNFLHFWVLPAFKLPVNMLMKLTQGRRDHFFSSSKK